MSVDRAFEAPPQPGDGYEIRGSFDPAWVIRVPRSAQQATLRHNWVEQRQVCGPDPHCKGPAEPLDPFDPANHRAWPPWYARQIVAGLATTASVPALYGRVADTQGEQRYWDDPYFAYTSVVMDVRNPAYRDWSIRRLMYAIRDAGFEPGEPVCVKLAYKPGWYTWYDEAQLGPSRDPCALPGSHLWTGPAHVCRDGRAPGGPFDSGLYGPGEYEDAVNAWFREMFAKLPSKGYSDLRIITVERPRSRGYWSILAEDVRRNPHLAGELGSTIEPALSELRGAPRGSDPTSNEDPPPAPKHEPGQSATPGPKAAGGGGSGGRDRSADAPAGGHVERSSGSGGGAAVIEPPE